MQYQRRQSSCAEDTSAFAIEANQQWSIHQAQQSIHQHAATRGTIHSLGVCFLQECVGVFTYMYSILHTYTHTLEVQQF